MGAAMEFPDLLARVCAAFQQRAGKQATLRARPATPENPVATLVFRPKAAKVDRIYLALPVPAIDVTTIARLVRDRNPAERTIVIAHFVAVDLAMRLKEAGIAFLDAAGNAYLAEPGFFLFVAGCPPPPGLEIPAPARRPRLFKATGLKLLFVLLARPEYLNRPYRDIADAAGVALGTVAWLMGDMKEMGYLLNLGRDGKRLRQREKLIDEWAGAYARELVPRHEVRRFRAENPDWWQTADLGPLGALWGGDVAADRLTGYLKPGEITVYAKGTPGPLLQAQRMRADPQGDVTVIEEFWNFPARGVEAQNAIVPPLLVYADLMATGDPRAVETAGLIHEKYLAGPEREA
jgi:hypothetical protein